MRFEALQEVFPQDLYPFPRREVEQRWLREIESDGVDCYVVELGSTTAGFAATRGDELLHFGIALEHWGSGLAQTAHDVVLAQMRAPGRSTSLADRLHRERARPQLLRTLGLGLER